MSTVIKAGYLSACVCSTFALFCTLTVVVLSVKRGTWKDMKTHIKVSLSLYLVCQPCFALYFFYVPIFGDLKARPSILGLDLIINSWICLHWLFSSLYLRTASLFRATFQTHNDEEFAKLKQRKKSLLCIQFSGLCIVFLFTCWYIVDFFAEKRTFTELITAGLGFLVPWPITMAILSLISARRISKQTKSI